MADGQPIRNGRTRLGGGKKNRRAKRISPRRAHQRPQHRSLSLEMLEVRNMLSHNVGLPPGPQDELDGYSNSSLQLDHTADPLTIILDFNDPGQSDTTDDIGNIVTTFDVVSYGFEAEDFDFVTLAILEEVRSDFYDIATSDSFPQSPIPLGQELAVEFEIGDIGELPVNGSNDYFYLQIGTGVKGDCVGGGVLGCANIDSIRSQAGSPGDPVGSVVGSVFTDSFLTMGGLSPPNALSIGSIDFTSNVIGGTVSHELGHAVSLMHLDKAGSVTPSGLPPIMATGAIDLPNQDRIGEDEFSYFGVNSQAGGQSQFHMDQLVGALGLHDAGTGTRGEIIVDTIVDENDGDLSEGNLSLREAIEQAIASGRRRKIIFDPSLAGGTIELDPSLTALVVAGPILIEGLGSEQLTILAVDPTVGQANGDGFGVFIIDDGDPDAFSNVQITGLRLTGADSPTAGGAISSQESLTLEDIVIEGNASAEKGGGIYSLGPLDIMASSINNNSAEDDGGGVFTQAGITLESSTVSDNSSNAGGGGIAATGEGTPIVIQSSTISGNTAAGNGGALDVTDLNPIKLRLVNSTVTLNVAGGSGGGVFEYNGVLVLDHAIVAGNSDAGTAPNIDNINFFASPVVLAKYSLVGDITGAVITQFDGNLLGTAVNPIDPLLGPLADNGGPTKTHQLMAESPAINAGDPEIPNSPAFDQRGLGFDRINLGVIDMGSFESSGFSNTLTVDSLADENDGDFTTGNFSLREAIELANGQPGSARINFAPALSGGVIALNSALGELLISSSIAIDAGDLGGGLTVDATSSDPTPGVDNGDGIRLLRIDDGDGSSWSDVSVEGITLTGGDVDGDGGAIQSRENLSLSDVSILENSASGRGGGLFHLDGSLLIDSSTVANNRAAGDGGGLWSDTTQDDPRTGRVTNSTFSTNTAAGEGGGIFNFDGMLTLEYSTVTGNRTSDPESSAGAGVFTVSDANTQVSVFSTIIAGNLGRDVVENPRTLGFSSYVSMGYNLIGVGNAILSFDNNDITEVLDPGLGELANNGGKTWTHAPQAGSLAIDASDPSLTSPGDGLPEFDQRGAQFSRLGDGDRNGTVVLDIGAVEIPTPDPEADFDQDLDVDGIDFLAWQRGFGITTEATLEDGDANGDGAVDAVDLEAWVDTFGEQSPIPDYYNVEETPPATQPMTEALDSSLGDRLVRKSGPDLRGIVEQVTARDLRTVPRLGVARLLREGRDPADRREVIADRNPSNPAQRRTTGDMGLAHPKITHRPFRHAVRADALLALDEVFTSLAEEGSLLKLGLGG